MPARIGDYVFDHVVYDRDGDVRSLRLGPLQAAAATDETPEGHAVRDAADGRVLGSTLVNARWLLERDGVLFVAS